MHTSETRIYFALLTGIILLVTFLGVFVIMIVKYQRKKIALHRIRITSDMNLLERERARIASDLHDDLGSSLSSIKINLQCIPTTKSSDTLLLEKAEKAIDDSMQKLRMISFNMMPQTLQKKGLTTALRELLDTIRVSNNVQVAFRSDIEISNTEKSIHLYRISQEILNNIIKHANATIINTTISSLKGTHVELNISDNGIGFDQRKVKKNKSLGLQTIVSRVDILNGKIYLNSAKGQGTRYSIIIPAS